MVPENVKFVLDGIVLSRMQSTSLVVVFQRRVDEDFAR